MSAEKRLQTEYGTSKRAEKFEKAQKIDYLNEKMVQFIGEREMAFIATADAEGNCDNSIRNGPVGFMKVIDRKTLIYPEYRGNGVYASLGNIVENPHIGLLLVDFFGSTMGLHINGRAEICENGGEFTDALAERWVRVEVEEAYIHCSKHIPKLTKSDKEIHWNTDDSKLKGGDYFAVST